MHREQTFTNQEGIFTKRIIPTSEKTWTTTHALSRYGGDLAVSASKMLTTMLRHYDQDERQPDGSRRWDSIKPVLMKLFAQKRARDFDDEYWSRLIHDGSTFGKDLEEEKPYPDFTVPQKAPNETRWKRNQDAVYLLRLKEAQDQGLEFWQTKSFAIMTYATIQGDCIDCVTAQN